MTWDEFEYGREWECTCCGWRGETGDMIALAAGDECIWYCPECKGCECMEEVDAEEKYGFVTCPDCEGSGFDGDKKPFAPCPICGGEGKLKRKEMRNADA